MGEESRALVIAVAVGVLLAVAGAFGTEGASLARRLAYWIPMMLAGTVLGSTMLRTAVAYGWLEERPWPRSAAIAVVMALPLSVGVWAWTAWLMSQAWAPIEILAIFPPVLAVCLVMTALNTLAGPAPMQTRAAVAGQAPPRFLERLPFKLKGAEIQAVEAEDHYLRIHTARGSDLILMRLSDAIGELEGIEGAQTHRSWWVAKAAIAGVERTDGRALLTLADGTKVPVSRTFARALRAKAWI